MARAITSKQEYFNLRNSAENRSNLNLVRMGNEDAKGRLVQFAYNDLMPDGVVKGCQHPSRMFAYDVDCQSREESDRIASRLLEMKEQIGLLEISRSARYGLHLILLREKGKTVLENQVRVSMLTKTEMDTGAHDLGRVMFTTTADADELLYLDDRLFDEPLSIEESEAEYQVLKHREANGLEELPAGAKKANKHYRPWEDASTLSAASSAQQRQAPSADDTPQTAKVSCLKAFDLCMEEAGLTERALQIEGVRHNSLLSIFSVGACRLMPIGQMKAVVKVRMPEYAEEHDCQQLIQDFYQNYTEMNKPLNKRLREIHAEVYGEETEYVETESEEAKASHQRRKLIARLLPSGLREPVMAAPKDQQMNVLCAIMPIAAAYADQVEIMYADEKKQYLGLMSLIISRQAGGKSGCKEAVECWMKILKEESKAFRDQEDAVKLKNKCRKANERAQELPKFPIRKVPITISCSIYNWTIFGTYGSFRKCFQRENAENGLGGRVLISELPDTRFTKMPKYRPLTADEQESIQQAAQKLSQMSGYVDTPRLRRAIEKWTEEKLLLGLKNMDEVMDNFRRRSAVIAFRCAVIFHLLSGEERESKACVDFMLMMADYCLETQTRMLGDMISSQQANNEPIVKSISNQVAYDRLPKVFTMDDLRLAKGTNIEESSYRSIICKWKKYKIIEDVPREESGSDKRPRWRKLVA